MRVRILLSAVALCGAAVALQLGATAHADAPRTGVATCNQTRWCTITASGDVTPTASQLAIGNVSAGTELAVTQDNIGQNQVGGEILNGSLRGSCGWSQYARDWSAKALTAISGCADPVLAMSQFVADDGHAIWSGCYPRCFGGVPLRFDRRCGQRGHNWCYSSNCEEFANFYPWTSDAHPTNPLRMTRRHRLDVRYLARYGDAWTHTPFYLVRDEEVGHGSGNWVFVSGAACHISTGAPGTYHWLTDPSKPPAKRPTAHTASAPGRTSA
jgi:hypothetical protein